MMKRLIRSTVPWVVICIMARLDVGQPLDNLHYALITPAYVVGLLIGLLEGLNL